ncbi:MAG: alpha/beta hydrolase [Bacteroidota bacterium]
MKALENLIKTYYKITSPLFPKVTGRQAFNLFATTRRKKLNKREQAFYEEAEEIIVLHDSEDIRAYSLGPKDGSVIFLVHGWDSNAGSMAGIANLLVKQGFRVITFDLPAHGFSTLKKTNIRECAAVFQRVYEVFSRGEQVSVISHSFGSAVTTYGLSKMEHDLKHLIFLTAPDEIHDIFREFSDFINLSEKAHQHMLGIAEDVIEEKLDDVAVHKIAPNLNFERFTMIHDQFDRILPYKYAEQIVSQIPNAEFITLEKAGHYKMLWNEEVNKAILERFDRSEEVVGML